MEWIAVQDRLPENDYEVIIFGNILGYGQKNTMVTTGFYHKNKWMLYDKNNLNNVTHWMPLPEPPPKSKK